MKPNSYSILLCRFGGTTTLHLNGVEVMRSVKGVAALREFRYPSGAKALTVHHVPPPLPVPVPTLGGLVSQALALLGALRGGEGDHSRLVLLDSRGNASGFVNGRPAIFDFAASTLPEDLQADFLALAGRSDIEAASGPVVSSNPLMAEKDAAMARDVWSELPAFPRADWRSEVADEATSLGYWDWVEHKIEAAG